MIIPRAFLCTAIALAAAGAYAQSGDDLTKFDASGDDASNLKVMEKGLKLIQAGKYSQAIENCFDRIIRSYESRYNDVNVRYYCSRSNTESKFYRRMSGGDPGEVKILPIIWSMAYYLKAYSLIELERPSEAVESLEHAIALSPMNSQFLSEMGHACTLSKNWEKSLEFFQRAVEAAETSSPESVRTAELTRAWRGVGYAYIEMNRLDDAVEVFRKCLDLNPDDERAKQELEYIDQTRARQEEGDEGAEE